MPKWIKIPEDINIEIDLDRSSDPPQIEKRRFNFVRYFVQFLLDDAEVFGKSREGVLMAADIESTFDGKKPGAWVQLADAQFTELKKSYDKRTFQNGIAIWRKLVPFFHAIDEASSKDPMASARRSG